MSKRQPEEIRPKMKRKEYEKELRKLQTELCRLQDWVVHACLEATDTKDAPWYIVRSDDKRRARLNCISHLLGVIPYKEAPREKVKLPKRSHKGEYDDQATLEGRSFVEEKY